MNWEALSAIGDLIGAATILITLIYLAFQLRQNTRQVKIASMQSTMGQWNSWSAVLAGTPDLAEVVARGNANFHALSPAEALRYGAYIQMFFDAAENYHDLMKEVGIRGDESVLANIVGRRICIAGFGQWWDENRADYANDFGNWVDEAKQRTDAIEGSGG